MQEIFKIYQKGTIALKYVNHEDVEKVKKLTLINNNKMETS